MTEELTLVGILNNMTPRQKLIWWLVFIPALAGLVLVSLAQPIMPVANIISDTNEAPALTKQATLSWNYQTNALLYRWTNWNAATNQSGWTTTNNVPITFTLGTNNSAVRAEKGTNISAWTTITNVASITNAVGITKLETRTMAWQNGTWSPWMTTSFGLVAANNYMQQWRPVIIQTNWWILN